MEKERPSPRSKVQLFWGIALVLVGGGVLLRNVETMPRSVVVMFYIIAIVLIYQGAKKIVHYFRAPRSDSSERPMDMPDN